jgi:hypothetical protein
MYARSSRGHKQWLRGNSNRVHYQSPSTDHLALEKVAGSMAAFAGPSLWDNSPLRTVQSTGISESRFLAGLRVCLIISARHRKFVCLAAANQCESSGGFICHSLRREATLNPKNL